MCPIAQLFVFPWGQIVWKKCGIVGDRGIIWGKSMSQMRYIIAEGKVFETII